MKNIRGKKRFLLLNYCSLFILANFSSYLLTFATQTGLKIIQDDLSGARKLSARAESEPSSARTRHYKIRLWAFYQQLQISQFGCNLEYFQQQKNHSDGYICFNKDQFM